MSFLNIGCGSRIHPEWINVDKCPAHPSVKFCDVEQGLPFSDCAFDVVYHSHVIEHLEVNIARSFIKECFRVLKPKGILRVVVPDLEKIVLCYIDTLTRVGRGEVSARADYDWIMLELYDQVVRNSSGGQMAAFLDHESIPNRNFIIERCGVEAKNLMQLSELRRASKRRRTVPKKSSRHPFTWLKPQHFFRTLRERVHFLLGMI